MGNETRAKGLKRPITVLGLLAIVIVTVLILWPTGNQPKPVFDFDDGTAQGWTANGIYDDAGTKYDGNLYTVGHAEQHQYPDRFPCTAQNPKGCDPLNDKNGSLVLTIADLQPTLTSSKVNFPDGSVYWQVEIMSPSLSGWFQNKSDFEGYLGDMFSIDPGHIRAAMLLNVETGGTSQQITPVGGIVEQVISKGAWTKVSAKFNIPAGGYIRNIVVRIRGDWKSYKLYEGGVFLDHVGAVN